MKRLDRALQRAIKLTMMLGVGGALCLPITASAITTPNLLVNGNAELGLCTNDWTAQSTVAGWNVLRGAASTLCYSAFTTAMDQPVLPKVGTPGMALFAAPGADTAMNQTVDVSLGASQIDTGSVSYTLSGWLGGWGNLPDTATLTATFLDGSNHATGNPVVLVGANASARGNVTALVNSQITGSVPPSTRKIVVTVNFLSGMVSYHNAYADNLSLTLSGNVSALSAPAAAAAPTSTVPALDHVYVVMMENTNYADVVHTTGNAVTIDSRMPFLSSLAANGVILSNMWGVYHPSDQNYVAMVAGNTFKYGPVYFPYKLTETNLGDLLEAQGKTWKAYVQNMQTPCNLSVPTPDSIYDDATWFAPDDEPFSQFKDVVNNSVRCEANLRDLSDFESAITSNTLPNFAWIAADGWWDGEGAWYVNYDNAYSITKQDHFLQTTLQPLLQSAQWKNSRSLLIITWDEADGWGWPDNHVAMIAVGSPGLLNAGSIVNHHVDDYSVLRTIESAFNLGNFGLFDLYAKPLNKIFANNPNNYYDLRPAESLNTRGTIAETFGTATAPAAVTVGQVITLLAPTNSSARTGVSLAPLGQVPNAAATVYSFDPTNNSVSIPTQGLTPGIYGAWLRQGTAPPYRAPFMINVLEASTLSASQPGVEIAGLAVSAQQSAQIREGGNVNLNYCRPSGVAAAKTWIGIFPTGTPSNQLTQANALLIGFWLATPGATSANPCGQAEGYASELTPNQSYEILLLENKPDGSTAIVGSSASFVLTPALP